MKTDLLSLERDGPQIVCTGCQGSPVRFRSDVGTCLCDRCYDEVQITLEIPL